MRSFALSIIAVFLFTSSASAEVIATWNFNGLSNDNFANGNTNFNFLANTGTNATQSNLNLIVTTTSSGATGSNIRFGVTNADRTASGNSFALTVQATSQSFLDALGEPAPNNGSTLTFRVRTLDFRDIQISYDRSHVGFTANLAYSVNGGVNYITTGLLSTTNSPVSNYTTTQLFTTAFANSANLQDLFFRITLNGAASTSDFFSIDNISVTGTAASVAAVPEPSSCLLAVVGIVGAVTRFRSRRKK